jgi:MoaA/NifB/PqqE/SkfB family radical SAM enzyme
MNPLSLNFLQLEVTAQCNLRCTHCYAESDSHSKHRNALTLQHYKDIAAEAFSLGTRSVQLIGGEPAIWPGTSELLYFLKALGYNKIEYYSNFTILPTKVAAALRETAADLAVTVMSHRSDVHDGITQRSGSWGATIANIRLMSPTNYIRASVNVFPDVEEPVELTVQFLRSLGITDIRVDRVREVGRARASDAVLETKGTRPVPELVMQLCGACVTGSAYVAASGDVHFCGFSREISLGNVLAMPLAEILGSDRFISTHGELKQAFAVRSKDIVACHPSARCNPESDYCPPGPCGPRRIEMESTEGINSN